MRLLVLTGLLFCAFPFSSLADKPNVTRPMMKDMEANIDQELARVWPDDPVQVLGLTQGAYVDGYGAVFMAELNLAPSAGISPFHPQITADEAKRLHDKKATRLPQLKNAMREILMKSAGALGPIPDDQQIAIGISFFYWHGESIENLPSQIVMHGQKRALMAVKAGQADKSTLATVVAEREF